MKIAHVLDMAGQASIIVKYLKKENYNAVCYYDKRKSGAHISRYYNSDGYSNVRKIILKTILSRPDIVHLHSAEVLVPLLKPFCKKIILHYHGSDINDISRANSKFRIFCRNMADIILYNDKDMKIPTMTKTCYVPDIIDTELFFSNGAVGSGKVTIISSHLNKEKIKTHLPNDVVFHNISDKRLSYIDMPQFLKKYAVYYDHKITDFGVTLKAFSNTGLQALACGLHVHHNGKIYNKFPEKHLPKSVISTLINIYNRLISNAV